METCKRCGKNGVVSICGHCSDSFTMTFLDREIIRQDYVPKDMGIGGGDNIEFEYCIECGQIQDRFPKIKKAEELYEKYLEENQEEE